MNPPIKYIAIGYREGYRYNPETGMWDCYFHASNKSGTEPSLDTGAISRRVADYITGMELYLSDMERALAGKDEDVVGGILIDQAGIQRNRAGLLLAQEQYRQLERDYRREVE